MNEKRKKTAPISGCKAFLKTGVHRNEASWAMSVPMKTKRVWHNNLTIGEITSNTIAAYGNVPLLECS